MLVRLLFVAAFGVSAYLAWNSWNGGGVPGCGPESDCDKVLSSRWAYLLGLPITFFALPIYAAGIALLFQKALLWRTLMAISSIVLIAAIWFLGLQVFAVRAFCKFCMTAHAAASVAAIILLVHNPLPRNALGLPFAAAAGASLLMIAGQVATPERAPLQVASSPNPALTNSVSAPAPDPTFTIVQGQFTLNLKNVPVSGQLNAPKKMVKLFDYTCHHCRHLHHLLEPVKRKYSNELAVISLPMPLESSCNPIVKRTSPSHVNACEYAKLALALFLAAPEKFEEFSNWLFAPERPPQLASAREFAERLVGAERLTPTLADPRINEQIKTDADIYMANSRVAKNGAMPQMIFAGGASVGAVQSAAQLEKILMDALGLGSGEIRTPAAAAPGTTLPR